MPCQTVTVEANDESQLEVSSVNTTRQSRTSYEVSAAISNTITSGSGVNLSGTATLSVDGNPSAQEAVNVSPGGSTTVSFTVSDLSPGNHEMCIEV